MANDSTNVVHLAPAGISHETVQTFDFYTDEARKGALIGAAVILLKPGGGYDIDLIGEAGADPERVLGLVRLLELQVCKLIGI